MERKQATLADLLGRPCVFKDRMPYDSCRACSGRDYHCENYVPVIYRQQQTKPRDDKLLSLSDGNKFVDKPAADPYTFIRRANDGGCVA